MFSPERFSRLAAIPALQRLARRRHADAHLYSATFRHWPGCNVTSAGKPRRFERACRVEAARHRFSEDTPRIPPVTRPSRQKPLEITCAHPRVARFLSRCPLTPFRETRILHLADSERSNRVLSLSSRQASEQCLNNLSPRLGECEVGDDRFRPTFRCGVFRGFSRSSNGLSRSARDFQLQQVLQRAIGIATHESHRRILGSVNDTPMKTILFPTAARKNDADCHAERIVLAS